MAHRGKRSQQGTEKRQEREELHNQQKVAKWLIDGTKYKDQNNRESVVTISTEWVYAYIADCLGEPNPKCAPQQLDGTVTDVPNLFHYELLYPEVFEENEDF